MPVTKKERAKALREFFQDSTPESLSALHAAGLHEFSPKMNGRELATKDDIEDGLIADIDRRRAASTHNAEHYLRLAKGTRSYVSRAFALATAKRLHKGKYFSETAAAKLGTSKRDIERRVKLGTAVLPNLAQAIANGPYDNPANLKILAALSLPEQWAFAIEAQKRRLEDEVRETVFGGKRMRQLSHGELNLLERIGLDNAKTLRRLAVMSRSQAVKFLSDLVSESRADARRKKSKIEPLTLRSRAQEINLTPARDTLGAAFAAASKADREYFLQVHGLQRAPTIPGENFTDQSQECGPKHAA